MINLVIDFNNIAMRAMYACIYMRESGVSNYDTSEECGILARKITTDIAFILHMFGPDRVIFVCDSKHPWREQLYESIPGMEYKGNRVKDEEKNWNNIFNTMNRLKDIYEKKGFITCEIEHAEADDLAALYKDALYNKRGENVIMVSSDRDWCQLIDFNKDKNNFCIVYNPIANNKGKKKIYLTEQCSEWLNAPEITNIFFSNYSKEREAVRTVSKDPKNEIEVLSPEQILTDKIVCGDDGDNVPGFYEFYQNGKKVRFTALRMKKLFEAAGITDLNGFKEKCIAGSINDHIAKLFKREINDMDSNERLMRQRRLVELNPILFPTEETNTFASKYEHEIETTKGRITGVTSIKMEDILKGTDYLTEGYERKPRENAIFKNFDTKLLDKFVSNSLF